MWLAGTFSGTFTNPGTSNAQLTFTAGRPLPAPVLCKISVEPWANSGLRTPIAAQTADLESRTVSIRRADGTVAVAAQAITVSPWVGDVIVLQMCSEICKSGYYWKPCDNTMNGASGAWTGGHYSYALDLSSSCNGGLSGSQPKLWLQYELGGGSYALQFIVVDWQEPCKIAEVQFTFSDGSSQTYPAMAGCVPDAPAGFTLAAVSTGSVNMTFTMAASATKWQHAQVNSFMAYGGYLQPSTPAITHSILELSTSDLNTSTSLDFSVVATVGLERGDSIVLTLPHFQGTAQPTALVPEPLPVVNCVWKEMDAVDGVVSGDMVRSADPARSFVWVPPDSNATETPDGMVTFRIWTPVPCQMYLTVLGRSDYGKYHSRFDVLVDGAQADYVYVGYDASYDGVGGTSMDWQWSSRMGCCDSYEFTVSTPGEHALQVWKP